MNRTILTLLFVLIGTSYVAGQKSPTKEPGQGLTPDKGYIMINDLTGGIGLGLVNTPMAKSFFGFTTIHGYQLDKNFVVAAGTGFSAYNGGNLIPLFLDLRYHFPINPFTPFASGDGGVLFNTSGGTKLFINPAVGVRYALNRNVGFNFSTGLFVQTGNGIRDSFINFKLGVTYIPRK
jgi:hypothetical protein